MPRVRLGGRGTRPANFTMNVCWRCWLIKKWGRQPAFFFVHVWRQELVLLENIKAGHFAGIKHSFCALGLVRWAERSAKPKVQKPYPAKMRRLWHLVVLCSGINHAKQLVRPARRRMSLCRGYRFGFEHGKWLRRQPVHKAGDQRWGLGNRHGLPLLWFADCWCLAKQVLKPLVWRGAI